MPRNSGDDRKGLERALGPRGEVYVEYTKVGQTMKVTAIDAQTGIEVVIMGPVSASQNDLKRVAVRKLKAQLDKENSKGPNDDPGSESGPGSKGWLA